MLTSRVFVRFVTWRSAESEDRDCFGLEIRLSTLEFHSLHLGCAGTVPTVPWLIGRVRADGGGSNLCASSCYLVRQLGDGSKEHIGIPLGQSSLVEEIRYPSRSYAEAFWGFYLRRTKSQYRRTTFRAS